MPQYAIIHTATRVIRWVTTNEPPDVPGPEFSAVAMAAPIDCGGGPWKLDGSDQQVAATLAEWRQAGGDEAFIAARRAKRRQAMVDHLADMETDVLLPAKVRAFAQRMREFLEG